MSFSSDINEHSSRLLKGAALVFAAVCVLLVVLVALKWPFTQPKVTADLEKLAGGKVTFGSYSTSFFHPGADAEDVTFSRPVFGASGGPIHVQHLAIRTSWHHLLSRTVDSIEMDDITGQAALSGNTEQIGEAAGNSGSGAEDKNEKKTKIEAVHIHNAKIEVQKSNGTGLPIQIVNFVAQHASAGQAMPFDLRLVTPKIGGVLHVNGTVKWPGAHEPLKSDVDAKYDVTRADLSGVGGLAGAITAKGTLKGALESLTIAGDVNVPDFRVGHIGHRVPAAAHYQGTIGGKSGNIELPQVDAQIGRSHIHSQIHIGADEQSHKIVTTATLKLDHGRFEDWLYLLTKDPKPAFTGDFTFAGNATLPSGKTPFKQRVVLAGNFEINSGEFTNQNTQGKVEKLSETAEGDPKGDPEHVLSDFHGHVLLQEGTFHFETLSFHAPGGVARLHGDYSLLTKEVDLRGKVYTEAPLSKETTGAKSFFVKIISPFLKKNQHGGAIIPVKIVGKYPHPQYKTDPI